MASFSTHRHVLGKVGGETHRQAAACQVCHRPFAAVPFGHHFRTSWGAIDVCQPCTEDLYATVFADVAGGLFSLRRDIEELRTILSRRLSPRSARA